jgi:hypothetical protein
LSKRCGVLFEPRDLPQDFGGKIPWDKSLRDCFGSNAGGWVTCQLTRVGTRELAGRD